MRLANDATDRDVSPYLAAHLGLIEAEHKRHTGEQLVITSLWRPRGARPSKHSPEPGGLVEAADLRRWFLDHAQIADPFCRALQRMYGSTLGVVLEPEWLSAEEIEQRGGLAAIGPHVHVQLKRAAWPAQ